MQYPEQHLPRHLRRPRNLSPDPMRYLRSNVSGYVSSYL